MPTEIIFTLTGPDRVGIVEKVTKALLDLGGNVQTSRMARLGGEFAILMLAALPEAQLQRIEPAMEPLRAQGYRMTFSRTQQAPDGPREGWRVFRIEVRGADHEGIIHEIAQGLSRFGINIESMETGTAPAPMSGIPLFSMAASVAVPPELDEAAWKEAVAEAAQRSGVDIAVTASAGSPES